MPDNKILVTKDKNNNSIVTLKTTNIYHNPFYENVTYFVSNRKNLIRIESKMMFDKENINDQFLKNSYIDKLDSDIINFTVKLEKNGQIIFYIKIDNKEDIYLSY
jgi:hypothetical protein